MPGDDTDFLSDSPTDAADAGPAAGAPPAPAGEPALGFAATAEGLVRELAGEAGDPSASDPVSPGAAAAGKAPPPSGAPAGPGDAAAAGDVLGRWGIAPDLAAKLPPEVAAPLTESLGKLEAWQQEANAWAQQTEAAFAQREQRNTDIETRLDRIAGDPRFRQALQAYLGGGGRGPANAGRGAEPPFKPETEGERILWEQLQGTQSQYADQLGRLEQQNRELTARLEAYGATQQEVVVEAKKADLAAAHRELDPQFPELAADPAKRQEWHDKTAAYVASGYPLIEALTLVAKAMSYDSAHAAGQRRALEGTKKVARQSLARPDATRSTGTAAPPASLKDAAAQAIAERPELAAGFA